MITHRHLLAACQRSYDIYEEKSKDDFSPFGLLSRVKNSVFDIDVHKSVSSRSLVKVENSKFKNLNPESDLLNSGYRLYKDEKYASHCSAVAYYNDQKKSLIIAYRGSVTLRDWIITDPQIAISMTTRAQHDAKEFAERVLRQAILIDELPIDECHFTGHSKGGNEAQFVTSAMLDRSPPPEFHCTTYNAPGINKSIVDDIKNEVNNGLIQDIRHSNFRVDVGSNKDFVSLAGTQLGDNFDVKYDNYKWNELVIAHVMPSVEAALIQNDIFDSDVRSSLENTQSPSSADRNSISEIDLTKTGYDLPSPQINDVIDDTSINNISDSSDSTSDSSLSAPKTDVEPAQEDAGVAVQAQAEEIGPDGPEMVETQESETQPELESPSSVAQADVEPAHEDAGVAVQAQAEEIAPDGPEMVETQESETRPDLESPSSVAQADVEPAQEDAGVAVQAQAEEIAPDGPEMVETQESETRPDLESPSSVAQADVEPAQEDAGVAVQAQAEEIAPDGPEMVETQESETRPDLESPSSVAQADVEPAQEDAGVAVQAQAEEIAPDGPEMVETQESETQPELESPSSVAQTDVEPAEEDSAVTLQVQTEEIAPDGPEMVETQEPETQPELESPSSVAQADVEPAHEDAEVAAQAQAEEIASDSTEMVESQESETQPDFESPSYVAQADVEKAEEDSAFTVQTQPDIVSNTEPSNETRDLIPDIDGVIENSLSSSQDTISNPTSTKDFQNYSSIQEVPNLAGVSHSAVDSESQSLQNHSVNDQIESSVPNLAGVCNESKISNESEAEKSISDKETSGEVNDSSVPEILNKPNISEKEMVTEAEPNVQSSEIAKKIENGHDI